jgi:integrase
MSTERPPAKGEPGQTWNDPKTAGLRIRFGARGGVWYLFYRTRAGKQRNYRIGDMAAFSLTAARLRAQEVRAEVSKGNDPSRDAKASAARETLQTLRDWHIDRHVRVKLKESAVASHEQAWDKDVLPFLKPDTAVADVTEADIERLHHAMRKRPVKANRVAAMLSKAFNLAEKWGWRPKHSNPVSVERYREKNRTRLPHDDEPIRLMKALDEARKDDPVFVSLIELICLTGARVSEIRTAKRAWVRKGGLHLPDSKTGEKVLPLSSLARDVIASIQKRPKNPYLIPGDVPGKPLVNYHKPWKRVLTAAGIKGLHVHDLRRFFASAGLSGGASLSAIGQVLGHASAQTTKIYAFLTTDAAQATAEVAAKRVNELMRPLASAQAGE